MDHVYVVVVLVLTPPRTPYIFRSIPSFFFLIEINADARSHKPTIKKSVIIMLEQWARGEPLTKIIASTVQYALLQSGASTNWTVDKWSTSPSDKMKNIYTFFLVASPPPQPLLRCRSSFFRWFCLARIRRHRLMIIANSFETVEIIIRVKSRDGIFSGAMDSSR